MKWTTTDEAINKAWNETRVVARRLAVMAEDKDTRHMWMNYTFDQGINVLQSCIETLRESIRR